MSGRMSPAFLRAWIVVTGGLAAVCVLAALPPFVSEGVRNIIMDAFAPLCHQLAGRSFSVGGVPLAVGHRCTGIYVGLVIGALALPFLWHRREQLRRNSPLVLLGLLGVLGIEWMSPLLGEGLNTVGTRVITGLLFGVGAGYYAAEGVTELLSRVIRDRSRHLRAGT